MVKRVRGMSISTRVTLLTFVAVTAAVVLVALISIYGVYQLTLSEDLQRVVAYRQLLSDDLDARFRIVDTAVDALAADVMARGASSSAPGSLAPLAGADRDYFDAMMLVDMDARTIASLTPTAGPLPRSVRSMITSAPADRSTFVWIESSTGREGHLWVVYPQLIAGKRRAITGRVITAFMVQAADEVAQSRPSVSTMIVDANGRAVHVGRGSLVSDFRSIKYDSKAGPGVATVTSSGPGLMRGSWASVEAATGLDWRVIVLESATGSLARARAALTPAGLATLFVVVVAVLTALMYSRRLTAPLVVFERRAREVAAGGYIRPLRIDRDDELGRVAEAFNEMGVRLNSLQDVSQLLASASRMDDVLDAVLNAIGHILGTGDAAVLLEDAAGSALELARGRGLAVPDATLMLSLDEVSPVTAAFHDVRATSFLGDAVEGASAVYGLFNADSDRAGVAVPLTTGSEVLGVVVVLAPGRRSLTDSQVETLQVFSANAAVAVRTSRLFAEEQRSRTEAEALRSVAELTAPASDLAQALERASEIAAGLLGYKEHGVVLDHRERLGLGLAFDEDLDTLLTSVWRLVLAAHPERSDHDDTPLVVREGDEPRLTAMLGASWSHALFVPLLQGRSTRGALILHDGEENGLPTERQIAVARTLGREMSLVIRNAYLLQQARSRATNLETVFRISQAVSSELQITVVLNRVLDVVQKILSADAVALMSYDPERGTIETSMARGIATAKMLYFAVAPGEDIPGQVFEQRTPLVYGGLSHRPTPLAGLAADQGFESLLAVPLLARGRSIGVLTVYSAEPDAFSGEDMELLSTFASQAAIAIDTAALFGKEHHVSSVLQASILPEVLPEIEGLETASVYLPSGTEAEIGGDYYDMFFTADGRLGLAIGDVCGKGVAAATKTSMVKYVLRGLLGAGLGPGAALAELNRQVALAGDPSDIVTVWIATLDLETGTLVYANGGHPPGLLRRGETREIVALGATGPLLGALPEVAYEEASVGFEEGDLLLLYTDGVTESRRALQFFGEGRVRRVVRSCVGARDCVEGLLEAVQRFSAGPLHDDAAALAIRRVGAVVPMGGDESVAPGMQIPSTVVVAPAKTRS